MSLIVIAFVYILLAGCNQNPIASLEAKIQSGQLDSIPPLETKATLPDSQLIEEELTTNKPQLIPANDVDMSLPEFTPTPTPASMPNQQNTSTPQVTVSTATLKTTKGNITLSFYPDIAPGSVNNFVQKSSSGFYQNKTFHRVEDWVIQGGDPRGNGTGGGNMPTELSDRPFTTGSVGIARGNDIKISNDSQFFICKSDCSFLTGQYTLIGQVESGMDVVDQIQVGDQIVSVSLN